MVAETLTVTRRADRRSTSGPIRTAQTREANNSIMAKKSTTGGSRGPAPATLRRELEKVDRELVRLIGQRARLAQQLGRVQTAAGLPIEDVTADRALVERYMRAGAPPLNDRAVEAIFRELLSGCRRLVKPNRVAYLGPEYSYSHLATQQRFGSSVELAPVATISAVFEEVHRRQADQGIVPLENSTDGRVVDTLDMFARMPVRICGEVQLRIHHYLLGRCPRDKVSEVYSKPQALSQCRGWLAKHLPGVRTVEMTSTARAAQIAAEKEGAGAIASMEAGAAYGLQVLAQNIEDNRHNVTRFAVIGGEPAKRTGKDKTAMMLQIAHKPGALADAMAIFKRNQLNLTWIESFPLAGSKNEYLFFIEFEGHESDARTRRAIASLEKKTLRLNILGSYAKCEPLDDSLGNGSP
jgi:chorismate mutase / prephenate dehydratase